MDIVTGYTYINNYTYRIWKSENVDPYHSIIRYFPARRTRPDIKRYALQSLSHGIPKSSTDSLTHLYSCILYEINIILRIHCVRMANTYPFDRYGTFDAIFNFRQIHISSISHRPPPPPASSSIIPYQIESPSNI